MDVHESRNCALVLAVGEFPQDTGEGFPVIAERKGSGGDAARAALAMRVIEVGSADAHGDVRKAASSAGVAQEAAVSAGKHDKILIVDSVAEVVGRLLGLAELGDGA